MGLQTLVVQAPLDERVVVDFLAEEARWLAAPRQFTEPQLPTALLDDLPANRLILFRAEDLATLEGAVIPLRGESGQYLVDRVRVEGLFIEWNRTDWQDSKMPQAGRFYYDGSDASSQSSQAVERTMRKLQRWIRATYPLRSTQRLPTYVGPHCAESLRRGEIEIRHPNGTPMELVRNESAKS